MTDVVEVDGSYVGGDDRTGHDGKKIQSEGSKSKTVVIGAVKRKDNVVARVLSIVNQETMQALIRETVSTGVSLLATDEHRGYVSVKHEFAHGSVNHKAHKYVVGPIHANTIEGFWSSVKRSIVGSYHKVSPKYLLLDIAAAQFWYNSANDATFLRER